MTTTHREPFHGLDRTGMPADLATAERTALRRINPRRTRWPELDEIEQRVAKLEERRAGIAAELQDLLAEASTAPAEDAKRLAEWELADRDGLRPEPRAARVDDLIAERQADLQGLDRAIADVLDEKAQFVERHRKRLIKDADDATQAAHQQLRDLLDQVAGARRNLADLRNAAVWAATFPNEAANRSVRENLLAGGLHQPIEQTLGVQHSAASGAGARRAARRRRLAQGRRRPRAAGGHARPQPS